MSLLPLLLKLREWSANSLKWQAKLCVIWSTPLHLPHWLLLLLLLYFIEFSHLHCLLIPLCAIILLLGGPFLSTLSFKFSFKGIFFKRHQQFSPYFPDDLYFFIIFITRLVNGWLASLKVLSSFFCTWGSCGLHNFPALFSLDSLNIWLESAVWNHINNSDKIAILLENLVWWKHQLEKSRVRFEGERSKGSTWRARRETEEDIDQSSESCGLSCFHSIGIINIQQIHLKRMRNMLTVVGKPGLMEWFMQEDRRNQVMKSKV